MKRAKRALAIRNGKLKLSEAHVAQPIIDALRLHGWLVHPLHAERNYLQKKDRREFTGTPDYICVRHRAWLGHRCAQTFYLETKAPNEKLRASQEEWIKAHPQCMVAVADDYESFWAWYHRACFDE